MESSKHPCICVLTIIMNMIDFICISCLWLLPGVLRAGATAWGSMPSMLIEAYVTHAGVCAHMYGNVCGFYPQRLPSPLSYWGRCYDVTSWLIPQPSLACTLAFRLLITHHYQELDAGQLEVETPHSFLGIRLFVSALVHLRTNQEYYQGSTGGDSVYYSEHLP